MNKSYLSFKLYANIWLSGWIMHGRVSEWLGALGIDKSTCPKMPAIIFAICWIMNNYRQHIPFILETDSHAGWLIASLTKVIL